MLIWKNKHRPEFMSLLVLFTVFGEAKFAVRGCTEPAENSKNLKEWLGPRIYPSAVTVSPATGRGKKERRKKLVLAARICLFLICENTSICSSGQRRWGVSALERWCEIWNYWIQMQPHMTGHSLQTKLKQVGLNKSNTSCDYSSLCSNKSWR